ncbi:hypothetical protein Tco_1485199 [Tanacetum coccineum]
MRKLQPLMLISGPLWKELMTEENFSKTLNRVSKTLEADSALKEAMQKMDESNNTTFGNITSLAELLRNAQLPEILNQLNSFQSTLNTLSS